MPLYEFKCNKCRRVEELFFVRYHDSLVKQGCPVCGKSMERLMSRPRFNVMDAAYRPGIENKWNWNPKAAFSDGRECGAAYEHKRREQMTGRHRHDIGEHKHEWAHHLKGTKKEMKRRKAAANVR